MKRLKGLLVALAMVFGLSSTAQALILHQSTIDYGVVIFDITVTDNYLGDYSKYLWEYEVTNVSYDPIPGTSNGFSGFELFLPVAVPDIGDVSTDTGWIIDCCSLAPVEWDIKNSAGLGIMPGETGLFSFTTLPRYITTNDNGWFHSWVNDSQTITTATPGMIVPDVISPPIDVPEPATLLLLGSGLIGLAFFRRKEEIV